MSYYRLEQVFGVRTPPPATTYVDRAGLDSRIQRFLSSGRHLVIYGPSKQGKTALRRRALSDEKCILIQGRSRPNCNEIYIDILRQLGVQQIVSNQNSDNRNLSTGGEASGGLEIPFLAKGQGKVTGQISTSHQAGTTTSPFGKSQEDLKYVTDLIKKSGRRLVIDDFHYIPELEKQSLAIDLKAFLEYGLPLILIGAWEQEHIFIAYNGDLAGRIDEVNIRWKDEELHKVLHLGETALNIKFSTEIRQAIVSDASGNVGLLQRIAEKLCDGVGCIETRSGMAHLIDDMNALVAARTKICREEAVRYRKFGWSVSEGFPNSSSTSKNIYMRIIQVCVEADDAELQAGLSQKLIEDRVIELDATIRKNSIRKSLLLIDKLQSEKAIYPVIATFDSVSRVLNLADRELLFYRRYGGPSWPWEDGD